MAKTPEDPRRPRPPQADEPTPPRPDPAKQTKKIEKPDQDEEKRHQEVLERIEADLFGDGSDSSPKMETPPAPAPGKPAAREDSDSLVDLSLPVTEGEEALDLSDISVIDWGRLADVPPPETASSPAAGVDAPSDADLREQKSKPPAQAAVPPTDDILDLLAAARGEKGTGTSSNRTPIDEADFAHLVEEEDVLEDAGPTKPPESTLDLGGISSPRLLIDQSPIPLPGDAEASAELLLGGIDEESTTHLPHALEEPIEISASELVGEEEDPLVAGAESSGHVGRDRDHDPSIVLTQADLVGTGSSVDIELEDRVDLGHHSPDPDTSDRVDLGGKAPSIVLTPADLVGTGSSITAQPEELEGFVLTESDILDDAAAELAKARSGLDVAGGEYAGDVPDDLLVGAEAGTDQPHGSQAEGAVDDSLVSQDSSFELLTSDLIVESPTGGTNVSGMDLGAHPGLEQGHELLEASGSLGPGRHTGMDLGRELPVPPDSAGSSLDLGSSDAGIPGRKPKKETSGIDLLAADVMEDLPPLNVPDMPSTGGGRSGMNLRDEDILLEAGAGESGATPRADSSRDLIAEAVESGLDLVGTGESKKKKKKIDDLDAFDLDSLTPTDDSSSVDLGSLANMPTADVVLGKKQDQSSVDLQEGSGRRKPISDEGIDIETGSGPDDLEEGIDLETAPVEGLAGLEGEPSSRTRRPAGLAGVAREEKKSPPRKKREAAAPDKPAEAIRPRGRAGAWVGGTLMGTLVGAGVCVALWLGGLEPPAAWREMVGGSAPTKNVVTTVPGPGSTAAATRFEDTVEQIKRGDFEKAKEALAKIDETQPSQLLARAEHRWFSYLQQIKGQNPAAKLDANANEIKKTLEELNQESVKNKPDAIYLRGQISEWTGDVDKARQEYQSGFELFKNDPAEKSRFEIALLKLDVRNAQAAGALLPLPRHLVERQALLVVLLLLQEHSAPASTPEEAGVSFWRAVKSSRDKKYTEALKFLEEARSRHDRQRFQKLRKPQNPLSDPTEEIFLTACDELKRFWELEGRLRNPDYLAAEPGDRVKWVDDLLARVAEKTQADLLKELTAGLIKEKPEKPIGNVAELVKAVNAASKGGAEQITKLESMVADRKKEVTDLGGKLKEATELAQATTKQLEVLEGREKALKVAEKEYRGLLQRVGESVGAKFNDPRTDSKPLLEGVAELVRTARLKDPMDRIRTLEAEVLASRAGLKERWAPADMLPVWLPVLDSERGRKDLAERAVLDAQRVLNDPAAGAVDKGKAELIRGLALRNAGRLQEAKPLLESARNSLAETRGEWLTRTREALQDVSDPANVYLRSADRLLAQGQTAEAVAVLGQAAAALPAENRGPILARRSLLALESARARGTLRAGNPAMQAARQDAEAAARAGLPEGHYALGRISEELGQFDQAVASYREAIKGTAVADEAGSRYRIALARVLIRSRTADARLAAPAPIGRGREEEKAEKKPAGTERVSTDFSLLLFTLLLQAPPGFPGGAPTAEQREAEQLADEVLAQGDKVPFDVRAQALAIKGFYTRALTVYTAGLREKGLLAPAYANGLLDLIAHHPALRRPESLLIPDPLEGERHYSGGLNFFFARNYLQAEREFLSAIQNDSTDARYFYFLGMSRLALGRRGAYEDLDQGARLERLGKPDRAAVSTALERIQGPMRQIVNTIRARPIKDIPR